VRKQGRMGLEREHEAALTPETHTGRSLFQLLFLFRSATRDPRAPRCHTVVPEDRHYRYHHDYILSHVPSLR
jgi:hypothetical protein